MALIQFNENVHLDPEKISAVHIGTRQPKATALPETFTEGFCYVGVVVEGEQFSIEEFPFGDQQDLELGLAAAERQASDRRDEIVDAVNAVPFGDQVWEALEALLPFAKQADSSASKAVPSDNEKLNEALVLLYHAMKKT